MRSKLKGVGLIGLGIAVGVAVSIQFSALAQKTAGNVEPLPLVELRQLADVFGLIKSDYVEPVDDKKLLTEAITGMVASLDPHSAYLDKKAFKELRESTQGKFVGLGIEVGMEDGYVKVISPIEGSPADRAGMKAGDLIVRLDTTPVKGMTLDAAVKKMRGEPHTKIVLTVSRKGEDRPLIIPVIREEIRVQSVKSKMIEPDYGWIRINQFQEPTVADLVKKLRALYAQSPHLKGLVLDLRNDPGGVLPGAIGVSAAFLPKEVVVTSTNGQLANSKATFYAKPEFYGHPLDTTDPLADLPEAVKKIPMVVLVNAGSASASEIVAGALQDHNRATIMGAQTFGKGSVQTIRQISADTAVKLTTARYYTPKGRSIQAKGITPDLLVDEYADGDPLNQFRLHESDLQKHLTNDAVIESTRKEPSPEEQQRLIAQEKKRKPLEFGSKEDFQLTQALNYLKGLPVQLSKVQDEAQGEKSNEEGVVPKK